MSPTLPLPPAAWFPGELHLEVVVLLVALGSVYVVAARRQGEGISGGRAACFLAALVALFLALDGPIHDLADRYLFSAHMVQHLLLTLVVPPLGLAGTPGWMIDAVLGRPSRSAVGAAVLRRLTRPLPALSIYAVALIAWHVPAAFEAALASHGVHVLEHLTLIVAAILGWWPVMSPSVIAPPLPYGARLLYVFVFGMPMTVVAAMITGADVLLFPFYGAAPRVAALGPLDDQRLGGLIMWVPAGFVPLMAFTAVFFRWVASEWEDPAEDEERTLKSRP
jgi:putative membrane protein